MTTRTREKRRRRARLARWRSTRWRRAIRQLARDRFYLGHFPGRPGGCGLIRTLDGPTEAVGS